MLVSSLYASSGTARAESPEYMFYQGNSHYKNGMYDRAIAEYSKIIEEGLESGNLYFNIGNAYFKKGELGKAVLYYERARRLIPNDSDLKANYKYAVSRIRKSAADMEPSLIQKIPAKFETITIDGLTILLSALYICILLLLILIMYFRKIKRPAVISIVILSVFFVLSAYSLYGRVSRIDKEAIIISEAAEARFEPIESATTHFSLYEGMKVYILESNKSWSKVKRFDGKTGWIMNSSMERI
jgi:tetratricopeptide (TPR) repeat protein